MNKDKNKNNKYCASFVIRLLPVSLSILIAAPLALAQSELNANAEAQVSLSTEKEQDGPDTVRFLSGGIGSESRAELAAASSDYRLKIVYSAQDGAFVADIGTQLLNSAGETIIDTISEGPIVLLNAPAGEYSLNASFEGQTRTRPVVIPASGQETLHIRWETPEQDSSEAKKLVPANMETVIEVP